MSRRKGAEVPTKAKNPLRTLKNLLKFLSNESVAMIVILVLAAIGNGLNLLGPRFSGAAIDAMGLRDLDAVYTSAFKMLAAYVIWAFLTYLTSVLMIRLSQRIVVRMRQRTFDKLVELPLSYLDSHQTGDLVSRISYDIDTINTSLSNDIIQILSSAITVVGSLVMMILISWELTLIFVVTVPISVIFTRYRVRLTRPLFSRRSRKLGDMNGFVEEVLTGHRTIQSYDREDEFTEWFDDQNGTATKAYYEAEYQSSINFPTISLITNLSLAMISMLGGLLFLQGRLTVGALSAFVLYSRKFSGPINEIANIIAELQSALSAAERVFELLDEPSEQNVAQPQPLPLATGKVEFDHVQFSYVENVPVIHDFSLKVQPGQLVAIVGPTGAGKTTLINLLMRFYQPQQGQILIDDVDINQADFVKVRQSFAMVLQDTWLFEGTIHDNI
ncbi:MAG TPA: ABC transporter ATP-binding protein, partial [Erysipelothrix sp.]|nr:ABC transporter ATP-binding protein [Erysipelothrix sp.]